MSIFPINFNNRQDIFIWFIIQNYAQLTQVYGKENAETIKGNCNITYLISSELNALEELSKLCGDKIVKVGKDKKEETRPLVTVSDLQRLKQYETISLRLRTMPFKTKLVPNWQMDWGKKFPNATYPEREKGKVELFDIREFVKAKKQEKMAEMMQEDQSSNGGGTTLNPLFSSSPMMGNPQMMGNPLFNPSMVGASDELNVDDLVKKIDAKIAELEEEERKGAEEKANAETQTSVAPAQVTPTQAVPVNNNVPLQELNSNGQKLYDDDTDNDKFFDDFFSDE